MTRTTHSGPRSSHLLLVAALAVTVASTGAPADRVVLGEYFTNLY
jgi:hypothetical protein